MHDTVAMLGLAARSERPRDDDFDELPLANEPTTARQAGHEALATAALSATPGSVVVDANDDRLVVHTVPIHRTGLRRAVSR